ncbi:MAG: hypothetical protein ACREPI_12295 [Candidatus Dormibacterales bacterium]
MGARAPVELLAVMRHVGAAHPSLLAHLAGSRYGFTAQPTEIAAR